VMVSHEDALPYDRTVLESHCEMDNTIFPLGCVSSVIGC
jgi:hypothetical protein